MERKTHNLDRPQSDDCFVMAFPAETTEAFLAHGKIIGQPSIFGWPVY